MRVLTFSPRKMRNPRCALTLPALWERSKEFKNRDFIVYENERYSYGDALSIMEAVAHELYHTFKVRKGDKVAIASRNYPEWIFALMAISRIGGVVVPINSWYGTIRYS